MRDLIVRAISERRVLQIDYEPGIRWVEPYAFGYSREGHGLIRAFQIEGASASGEHEWWKLFRLDRIRALLEDGRAFFGPRPEYRRGDRAMRGGIVAEL